MKQNIDSNFDDTQNNMKLISFPHYLVISCSLFDDVYMIL